MMRSLSHGCTVITNYTTPFKSSKSLSLVTTASESSWKTSTNKRKWRASVNRPTKQPKNTTQNLIDLEEDSEQMLALLFEDALNAEICSPCSQSVPAVAKPSKWIRIDLDDVDFHQPYLRYPDCSSTEDDEVDEEEDDPWEDYTEDWLSSHAYQPRKFHNTQQSHLRSKKKWRHQRLRQGVKDPHTITFRECAGRFQTRPQQGSRATVCIKARIYNQIVQRLLEQAELWGDSAVLRPNRVPHLQHYSHLLHERLYLIHVPPARVRAVTNAREAEQTPQQRQRKQQRDNQHHNQHQQQYAVMPAHALISGNEPGDLSSALVAALMALQHRDVTPEDYDLLLQLDAARVKPKTVAAAVVDRLKTERMNERLFEMSAACCICQEVYRMDEMVRHMPHCEHFFHAECIDRWLKNSSQNCPLDGIPVT